MHVFKKIIVVGLCIIVLGSIVWVHLTYDILQNQSISTDASILHHLENNPFQPVIMEDSGRTISHSGNVARNSESSKSNNGSNRMMYVDESDEDSLWVGNVRAQDSNDIYNISVVVSYCDQSLKWIDEFLTPSSSSHGNVRIMSITIYSVCNNDVKDLPSLYTNVRVIPFRTQPYSNETLSATTSLSSKPNYHVVYAHWISENINIEHEKSSDLVLFLHDCPIVTRDWLLWSIDDIARIATRNGFACAESVFEAPGKSLFPGTRLSIYHHTSRLLHLKEWLRSMRFLPVWQNRLVPVCYGGLFTSMKSRLYESKDTTNEMMRLLSTTEDDEEQYFAEWTWALLLSKPISENATNMILSRASDDDIISIHRQSAALRRQDANTLLPPSHLKPISGHGGLLRYPFSVESNLTALWIGNVTEGEPEAIGSLHVVVSHCDKSLHWLSDYLAGHTAASITIYSKCGKPVENAPSDATVKILPNVGRCDHTYAHHMASINRSATENEYDVFLFIKDNSYRFQAFHQWTLDDMYRIASGNGFACSESLVSIM